MDVLNIYYDKYVDLMNNGDDRVKDWSLMQNPLPTICICLSYVAFVKYIGPLWMKNRMPFNIRWLMVVYNFVMVLISLYIFVRLGQLGWFGKYSYRCQPVDYSNSLEAKAMANLAWWYYVSKFLEFCDTIFFVLRKKFSHVSTLHVIHHGIMPMSVWWGVKFTPGGHSTFFAFINSFVHILMYIYYCLAAIGPQMYKYLWWKKYMTTIQLIQFVIIFIHSFQLLFRKCEYPRGFMWWIGFHAILFWFLFLDFYKSTYSKLRFNTDIKPTFMACSPTESFINGLNHGEEDTTAIRKRRRNVNELDGDVLVFESGKKSDDNYSSTIKNGLPNGYASNGIKGKEL